MGLRARSEGPVKPIFIVTRAWLALEITHISPLKLTSPKRLESEPRFANTQVLDPKWSSQQGDRNLEDHKMTG